MQQNNETTNAFLMHISSFAGYLFPFGSIITPLILWQTQKDRSQFLNQHGKEAVNFNLSFGIYLFIVRAGICTFFFGNFFDIINGFSFDFNYDFDNNFNHSLNGLYGFLGIASIAGIISLIKVCLIIIASNKANNGEIYKYPFTIKFIQ